MRQRSLSFEGGRQQHCRRLDWWTWTDVEGAIGDVWAGPVEHCWDRRVDWNAAIWTTSTWRCRSCLQRNGPWEMCLKPCQTAISTSFFLEVQPIPHAFGHEVTSLGKEQNPCQKATGRTISRYAKTPELRGRQQKE